MSYICIIIRTVCVSRYWSHLCGYSGMFGSVLRETAAFLYVCFCFCGVFLAVLLVCWWGGFGLLWSVAFGKRIENHGGGDSLGSLR
jgi:hypothetical protein